jgi:hypothetical protein
MGAPRFFVASLELAKGFIAIDEVAAFGLGEADFDLGGNFGPVFAEPLLVLVEHLVGGGNVFSRGSIGALFEVLLDQRSSSGLRWMVIFVTVTWRVWWNRTLWRRNVP